mmetsp:Transcript_90779/g.241217  ORF Transcript_90779/g.241217 Transcript_90779/m.241217 type:complete len:211 (-) Transcript_90779:1082-1714(-)
MGGRLRKGDAEEVPVRAGQEHEGQHHRPHQRPGAREATEQRLAVAAGHPDPVWAHGNTLVIHQPVQREHAQAERLDDGQDVNEEGPEDDLGQVHEEVQVVHPPRQGAGEVPRGQEGVGEFGHTLAVPRGLLPARQVGVPVALFVYHRGRLHREHHRPHAQLRPAARAWLPVFHLRYRLYRRHARRVQERLDVGVVVLGNDVAVPQLRVHG